MSYKHIILSQNGAQNHLGMPRTQKRTLRQAWKHKKESIPKPNRLHSRKNTAPKHAAKLKIIQRNEHQY